MKTMPSESTASSPDIEQEFCDIIKHGNKIQVIKKSKSVTVVISKLLFISSPPRFAVLFSRSFSLIAPFKDFNTFVSGSVTVVKGGALRTYLQFLDIFSKFKFCCFHCVEFFG